MILYVTMNSICGKSEVAGTVSYNRGAMKLLCGTREKETSRTATSSYLSNPRFKTKSLSHNMNRQARASLANRPVAPIFHAAASKSLTRARAASPPSSPSPPSLERCHVYLDDARLGVLGERFCKLVGSGDVVCCEVYCSGDREVCDLSLYT
jgi:hypothetical protein